jgi:hypothetical protein
MTQIRARHVDREETAPSKMHRNSLVLRYDKPESPLSQLGPECPLLAQSGHSEISDVS